MVLRMYDAALQQSCSTSIPVNIEMGDRLQVYTVQWGSYRIVFRGNKIWFTKFLCDVERTSGVSMRPSAVPSLVECESQEGRCFADFADLAPKIDCHGNVPWAIAKRISDWTSTATCLLSTNPENLVKIGLVNSEISLLQAIVKKERKYNSNKT